MKQTDMKRILLTLAVSAVLSNITYGAHLPKAKDYRTDDPTVTHFLQAIRAAHSTGELNSVMVLKDGKKVLRVRR